MRYSNPYCREYLADYKGTLCVVYTDSLFFEPVLVRSYYPTQIRTKDFVRTFGEEAMHGSVIDRRGFYEVMTPSGKITDLFLKQGGSTLPVHTTEEPIPVPPNVRKHTKTEWREGRWHKKLQRGWVPI